MSGRVGWTSIWRLARYLSVSDLNLGVLVAVDGFSGLDFSAGSGAGVFSTSAQAAKSSATRNAHVRRIFTRGPPAAVDASQSLADSDAPR